MPVVLPLAPHHRRPPIRRRGRSGPWLRSANELRIHSRSRRYFSANAFLSYANACRPKLFHFTVSVGRFYKKGSPKSWVMSAWCVFPHHDFDSIFDLLTQLNCLNNTRIGFLLVVSVSESNSAISTAFLDPGVRSNRKKVRSAPPRTQNAPCPGGQFN